jgi:hypothetical protein
MTQSFFHSATLTVTLSAHGLSYCGTNTPHREPFQTSLPFILALRSYFKIDIFSTNTQISNLMKLTQISNLMKLIQISNLMKLRPVGAEMLHTDGHDNANSRFLQFCQRV